MNIERVGNNFFDVGTFEYWKSIYKTGYYFDDEGNKIEKEFWHKYESIDIKPNADFYLSGKYNGFTNHNKVTFSVNYEVYNLYYKTLQFNGNWGSHERMAVAYILRSFFPDYKYKSGPDHDLRLRPSKDDILLGKELEVVLVYGQGNHYIMGRPNVRRLLTFDIDRYAKDSEIKLFNNGVKHSFYDRNIDILKEYFTSNIKSYREKNKLSIMIRRLNKADIVLSNKYKFIR